MSHINSDKTQQLQMIMFLTVHSLGTFIFQTPPFALLSSSLRAKQAVNVTQTSSSQKLSQQMQFNQKAYHNGFLSPLIRW